MYFYRLLLHAYPASFRSEYGEEMCVIYAQRRRDASNPFLLAALWIDIVFDVLLNALRVHFDILVHDLRYAARTLARTPAFALTAIAVAALGIGATTAAFTMVDHVLLRPLPFADQDRLAKLYEDNSFTGLKENDVAPANYRDWKRMNTSFESMGCYRTLLVNLVGEGEPRQIVGSAMTAEMFPTLGVKPVLGRVFSAEDDRDGAPGTVVLSDSLWRGTFGGNASILGRKIVLDDVQYTVIGVMPKGFYFPNRDALLWTAMRFRPQDFEDRSDTYLYGIAKLKPGISLEKAATEMRLIGRQLERTYPKELAHVGVAVQSLRDDIGRQARMLLYVVLLASLCVLLVAATNLANLLLARALARRKELAVRAAMGAGRDRLVRQMLTESVALSSIGGVIGVLIAYSALPLLVKLVPVYLPIAEVPSIDLRVLLFAAAVTCGTGILFGLVPALRVCRGDDAHGLKEGSRSGVGGRKERLRSMLVVAEVAGSVVLLVGCGLLLRALWRVQQVDPGFRAENVLTLRTSLPMPKYQSNAARQQFYDLVLSQARALPGVTGVGYISFLPMVMGGGIWPVEVEGHPLPVSERQYATLRFITPGYFSTMGIPLVAGRDVADSDTPDAPLVAVVSESFVRKYWPGENPLSRRFNFGNRDRIVAGVVRDIHVRGLERSSEPQVYLPYRQHVDGVSTWYAPKDLVVRAGNAASLVPALRRIVHEADPEEPVSDVRMLSGIVENQTGSRRVQVSVLGAFAGIAFLLAAIGIHGLLSFAVSSRTQEIGVRMALGARSGDILAMILRDGLVLALIGIACGTILAYGVGRELQALLAGIQPGDIATFSCAIVLCLVMTLAGSVMPAVRAIRVDATRAIRTE
jgi:predicted permease